MRILRNHPGKSNWRLPRATFPDGRQQLLSGDQYGGIDNNYDIRRLRAQGVVVDEVPNVILEAALRISRTGKANSYVEDRDSGSTWEMGPAGVADMIRALGRGQLRWEGEYIVGAFTFRKQGTSVVLVPWLEEGPDAAPVPEGAPDLSDLVAALGPATKGKAKT